MFWLVGGGWSRRRRGGPANARDDCPWHSYLNHIPVEKRHQVLTPQKQSMVGVHSSQQETIDCYSSKPVQFQLPRVGEGNCNCFLSSFISKELSPISTSNCQLCTTFLFSSLILELLSSCNGYHHHRYGALQSVSHRWKAGEFRGTLVRIFQD